MRRPIALLTLLLSACPSAAPKGGPDACVPLTCGALCGAVDDGCGVTLACAPCPDGGQNPGLDASEAVDSGELDAGCIPEVDQQLCTDHDQRCGALSTVDHCGQTRDVDCGVCLDACLGESDPALCLAHALSCGPLETRDSCDQLRSVDCGPCPDGCVPETDPQLCAAHGGCGAVQTKDACGIDRTVDCGMCPDAGCQTEIATAMCARLGKGCGLLTANDLCGGPRTVQCGTCSAPNHCAVDNVCACTAKTCTDLGRTCGKVPDDCGGQVDCGPCPGGATPPPYCIRAMAANLSTGNYQSYDPGEGMRIFEGLRPDIVMIQEFNYKKGSSDDVRSMIDQAFGTSYWYYREGESTDQIPNGIISRFPIVSSGEWADGSAPNRDFAWAEIAVPGPHHLWAVSLHLLTSDAGKRASETNQVVRYVKANVPAGDFVLVGGDFNTSKRTEQCVTNLAQITVTTSPWPVDQSGNGGTSATRGSALDWVLASPGLNALKGPVIIGKNSFPNGLVFDSREYTPLADVAPVQAGDSGASNMQHMGVVREFCLPVQ